MDKCIRPFSNKLACLNQVLVNRTTPTAFVDSFSKYESPCFKKHEGKIDLRFNTIPERKDKHVYEDLRTLCPLQNYYITPQSIMLWNSRDINKNLMFHYTTNEYKNSNQVAICVNDKINIKKVNTQSLMCTGATGRETKSAPSEKSVGGPSPEQLDQVAYILSQHLPRFFKEPTKYSIFHPKIVYENNITNYSCVTLPKYAFNILCFKFVSSVKYAYCKYNVLKLTKHREDGSIRVRYQIEGINVLKVLFTFWRFRFWKLEEDMKTNTTYVDGFSIYYVGSDGLIYKHVVMKMQPDDDKVEEEKSGLAAKLALLLGLVSKDQISEIFTFSKMKIR